MPKSNFFTGQPIFNQLLSLIPKSSIRQLSRQHHSDRYCKKFKAYDHLVTMLFCCFHQCSSLREVITGLQANAHRLEHLGVNYTPRRSTLADANKRRDSVLFEKIFQAIYRHHYGSLPDSLRGKKLNDRIFIVDSTTISLFCDVMKGAGTFRVNGKRKGGIKAHVVTRAKDHVPCFIHLTPAASSDRGFMPMINLPEGSVLVMDRAYVNYKKMNEWTQSNITWVTRLSTWLRYEVVKSQPVSKHHRNGGILKDSIIRLGNPETEKRNPVQTARLISYSDKTNNRVFHFLTNNLQYSPLTIADLYKKRWDIELLFRRVKQNFQFHNFLGDNENAIKIQMWCSLIADLLISIIKARVEKYKKSKWSFANIAGLIRQHLSTYINLLKFLLNPEKAIIQFSFEAKRQLPLFPT
jgi:hypothetical protein